jgi:hypothetical protein
MFAIIRADCYCANPRRLVGQRIQTEDGRILSITSAEWTDEGYLLLETHWKWDGRNYLFEVAQDDGLRLD